jgi:hypothetical protein
VKHRQRHAASSSAPVSTPSLEVRAAEALHQSRFKEAIDLYKLLFRRDGRAEWKDGLDRAYIGRAHALAGKQMFKEAAMVLENAAAADGRVPDLKFFVTWLIRDGQPQKAAVHLLHGFAIEGTVPAEDRAKLEELLAALLLAMPQLPPSPPAPLREPPRWRELAVAARAALAAWLEGVPAAELELHLNRISLRSAFRPVRVLLKTLCDASDAERAAQLLATIAPDSPFFALRQAVEAVLIAAPADVAGWQRLTPAQQAFVTEVSGLPPASAQFLTRLSDASRGGAGTMFGLLLKQSDLPRADTRSACLNLLPQVPDRMAQFETSFGRLSPLERQRFLALAAEAREDWEAAELAWSAAAQTIGDADPKARLSQGVIYRHLAHLALKHPEIEGGETLTDPVCDYLERACKADPDHAPTMLELIARYRTLSMPSNWHRVVDQALQRFPQDSQVLQAGIDSAVARQAYKKAAGIARRLLQINAINPAVRRQMIELQVAHARKQMRAKRPDLAAKALAEAGEWERADDRRPLLHIAGGLVGLRTGPQAPAEARLREGVALAGGGVAGWFIARLEAELMKATSSTTAWLRRELAQASQAPPTKPEVMGVMATLNQPEDHDRSVGRMLESLRRWLEQAALLDWSEAEFEVLAERLTRLREFTLLAIFAGAALRRDPENQAYRVHQIIARTRNDAERSSPDEADELLEIAAAAGRRDDFHTANRIRRYLETGFGRPFDGPYADDDGADSDDDMEAMFQAMIESLPVPPEAELRRMVGELGVEQAAQKLAKELKRSKLGKMMPARLLLELCQAIVADTARGKGPRYASASGQGRF